MLFPRLDIRARRENRTEQEGGEKESAATRAKNQLRKVRGKSELDGLRDNSLVLPLVSPFEFASIGETDRLSVNSAPSIENKIGHFFFRSIINCPDFQFVENDKKKTIDPSIIVFSRRCMGFWILKGKKDVNII